MRLPSPFAEVCELHYHSRAVHAVGFSPAGDVLVSFGGDDNYTAAIWRDFKPSGPERDGVIRTHPTQCALRPACEYV